jgi:spore coat protein U-like protein
MIEKQGKTMKKTTQKAALSAALLVSLTSLALLSNTAYAGSTTAGAKATATIGSACTVSAGTLNFGTYNPTVSTNTTATSNISFVCTKNTTVTVNLNDSIVNYNTQSPSVINNSVSYAETNGIKWARYMSGATHGATLSYNLFQDNAFSKIFGGTNWFADISGHAVQVISTGVTQNVPVYGAVAYGQYVIPDNYSDTVPILLSF